MTWLTIVRGLRQRWWLLIVCPLAAILAVYFATSGEEDKFRSETTMVIAPTAIPGESFSTIDALRILEDRTIQGTFVEVASDDATVGDAAAQLGIDAERRQDFDVLPTIPVGSNLIEIAIVGSEALATQQLCQLVVDNAITRFATLYPMYTIQVLQPAGLPTDPQQQTGSQELALAALLGLGVAVLIAALWRRANDLLPHDAPAASPAHAERPATEHVSQPEHDRRSAGPVEVTPAVSAPVEEILPLSAPVEPGVGVPAAGALQPPPIFNRPSGVRQLADERSPEASPEGAADSRATAD